LPYACASPIPGSLLPRIKLEHVGESGHGAELSHYPSSSSMHAAYATDSGSYAGSTSGYLSDGQSSFRASDYQPGIDSAPVYDGTSANSPLAQDAARPYRITRPRRAPRRLTTREEANFQCEVKGCGKLFSRSYNFKAHMETHDEKREYPFPCLVEDCDKRFVRKTDLQRHHQSVHMKERSHRCDYCARLFARKDTLRRSVFARRNHPQFLERLDANCVLYRHMEDGCSKRFDIGTLDLESDNCDSRYRNPKQHATESSAITGPSPGSLPPMYMPPLVSDSGPFASTMSAMRNRDQRSL
jgi:hypothetical protein